MKHLLYLYRRDSTALLLLISLVFFSACSVAEPEAAANVAPAPPPAAQPDSETAAKGATITIEPNGPADSVRAFYGLLRENRFREAIFLTNLRPAIEGLTDLELKDFAVDFEAIAGQVPAEIEINGEIITGDRAAVTANLPNEYGDRKETQKITLTKQDGVWIIQTVDAEAARRIRAEGKKYFYNLRVETHEKEAKRMLERVSKAQFAYSLQNGGAFADLQTLVNSALLPEDVMSSRSTGYNYAVELASEKKTYFATATPAEYPKSGVRSFILKLNAKGTSTVSGKDTAGKPLRP
ncbi:MAG: hypothetical protein AB7J13_00900 [Pyrinomonadaceae bacterium]